LSPDLFYNAPGMFDFLRSGRDSVEMVTSETPAEPDVRQEILNPRPPSGRRVLAVHWLVLAAVGLVVLVMLDALLAPLLFLRADGVVTRQSTPLVVAYPATLKVLHVVEGTKVMAGQEIAVLASQQISQQRATLAANYAGMTMRNSRLRMRAELVTALLELAAARSAAPVTPAAQAELAERAYRSGLDSLRRRYAALGVEVNVHQSETALVATSQDLAARLPEVEAALRRAKMALDELEAIYDGGRLRAPAAGVVGRLAVAPGSVVTRSQRILDIYSGAAFVLAHVPLGGAATAEEGDDVNIRTEAGDLPGRIVELLPLTAELPRDLAENVATVSQAQVMRIAFEEAVVPPPLLTPVKLWSGSLLPESLSGQVERLWRKPIEAWRDLGE
jgi:multidrug efflux pump subunit AcrA (membrane-fusion protein)